MTMIKRRKTRQIRIGDMKVGGSAPISIQSMTNTDTANVEATISQIKRLEKAGCEIVRVAVKNLDDAGAIRLIKRKIKIPLVADIHFDYRLALKSIQSGADKIRLNPGNIRKKDEIGQVIKAAKRARIPIRIGVNSGSIHVSPQSAVHGPQSIVNSALKYIRLFESMEFRDIIISLKSSDVVSTVESYRQIAKRCDYPLHLGVTATGPYDSGIVKSSIGIGSLLLGGIGDTIRVSLTADPVNEVFAAKRILSSINLRRFGPDIISCPTCGRCQVDLIGIVSNLEKELYAPPSLFGLRRTSIRYTLNAKRPLTIAVMGCEVNGPGEAREADIGIAFGKGSGILFKKGKILKKVSEKTAISELLKLITYNL